MSKTATSVSQGELQNLYLQRQVPNHLVLQIIAFQLSQFNPKEIILRLSDQLAFIDCLLVGPYTIINSCITSTQYARTPQNFKPLDTIQVSDYFCKIDQERICQLRIIIRKIQECSSNINKILGHPQEISQLMDSNKMGMKPLESHKPDPHKGTEQTPIKIQQQDVQPILSINHTNYQKNNANNSQQVKYRDHPSKQDQTLTLNDIMNNKQGNFIGRLLRIKFGQKQTKDGPMSFLYLGLLDLNGDLVRINLAGRSALKQSRELKKHKCYLIKGMQLFQGDKSKMGLQVRLKEREYKIIEVQNEVLRSQFKEDYYRWQHENEWIQSEMVDVIGLVEQIQEKISYKNANTYQQQRDVVRLVIRNSFKTIKISFWADHIHILNNLNLQKNQPILLTDIKKKKSIFLDFIPESAILLLDQEPDLKAQLAIYLPPEQTLPQPTNIKELTEFYHAQPQCTKVKTLRVNLFNINQKWIIYKMCLQCKKKVEKILQICSQCQKSSFTYKYNCQIQLFDETASLNVVAFDAVCQQIFDQSANDFSRLSQEQIKQKCQSLLRFEYKSNIEHKNNRFIVRSLQSIGAKSQNNKSIAQNIPLNNNINNDHLIISNIKINNE